MRLTEWSTAWDPMRRYLANKTLLQTPFDRAMAGRSFIMRRP